MKSETETTTGSIERNDIQFESHPLDESEYSCKTCGTPVEPDKAPSEGGDYYCGQECHEDDRHRVANVDHRVANVDHRVANVDHLIE